MNTDNDNISSSAADTTKESYSQQLSSASHESEAHDSSLPSKVVQTLKVEWQKIYLEPIITLEQLSELHQQLQQYCSSRVQLIGKEVERVDTAALQLLVTFVNHPQITVGWIDPSPQLCIAAQLLGLSAHLGLPRYESAPEEVADVKPKP